MSPVRNSSLCVIAFATATRGAPLSRAADHVAIPVGSGSRPNRSR